MIVRARQANVKRMFSFPGSFPMDFVKDDRGTVSHFPFHTPCGDLKFVRAEAATQRARRVTSEGAGRTVGAKRAAQLAVPRVLN